MSDSLILIANAASTPVLLANLAWLLICGGIGGLFMLQAKIDRSKGRNPGGDD